MVRTLYTHRCTPPSTNGKQTLVTPTDVFIDHNGHGAPVWPGHRVVDQEYEVQGGGEKEKDFVNKKVTTII